MAFERTKRNGAWLALADMLTFGIFFLFYLSRVEKEIAFLTKKKCMRYYVAYLLGLITFLIVPIVWISRRANELREIAKTLQIEGKLTSFAHMFCWNLFGYCIIVGPLLSTYRFFDTLNKIEIKMNENGGANHETH